MIVAEHSAPRHAMTDEELRAVIEITFAPYSTPMRVETVMLACRVYAGELDLTTGRPS